MDTRTEQLVRALHQNPHDPGALHAVREHLLREGKARSLAKLLEWWADKAPTVHAGVQALCEAAELLEGGGGDEPLALLSRALERAPDHAPAMQRLDSLLTQRGEHAKLAELLAWQAAALGQQGAAADLRSEVWARLAAIRSEALNDTEGAIAAYRDSLAARPANVGAARSLASLLFEQGRASGGAANGKSHFLAAAEILATTAAAVSVDEALPLLNAALDCAPGHLRALELLEARTQGPGQGAALSARWAAFISAGTDAGAVDKRRALLAKAHADAGRIPEAIACLEPLAAKGHAKAQKAIAQLRARLPAAPAKKPSQPAFPAPAAPGPRAAPPMPQALFPRAPATPAAIAAEPSVVRMMRDLEEGEVTRARAAASAPEGVTEPDLVLPGARSPAVASLREPPSESTEELDAIPVLLPDSGSELLLDDADDPLAAAPTMIHDRVDLSEPAGGELPEQAPTRVHERPVAGAAAPGAARGPLFAGQDLGGGSQAPALPSFDSFTGEAALPASPAPSIGDEVAWQAEPAGWVPTPDEPWGTRYGTPENVDAALALLERAGVFEPPTSEPAGWMARATEEPAGTRIGRTVAIVWAVTLSLGVAGYFGAQQWYAHRAEQAVELVRQAHQEILRGEHENLVDAERHLRIARGYDPWSKDVPRELLLVHMQRALEEGSFDPGFLRPSVHTARAAGVPQAYQDAALAVLAAVAGNLEAVNQHLSDAARLAGEDAFVLYVTGRVEQILGRSTTAERLEAAVAHEPKLAAAVVALAESTALAGEATGAVALLDRVLTAYPGHLRAAAYRAFVTAGTADVTQGLAAADALVARLEKGSATEALLVHLARARLLERKGEAGAARDAFEKARTVPLEDPRLLALLMDEAERMKALDVARDAAARAVAAAPTNVALRKRYAEIAVGLREGTLALAVLESVPPDDIEAALLRTRAALFIGTSEAREIALAGLDSYLAVHPDAAPHIKAFQLRARMGAADPAELLNDARVLARQAPEDVQVAVALAETALLAGDLRQALDAAQKAVRLDEANAETHYVLGRVRRALGDGEGARQALARAIEILPYDREVQAALGRLLLDLGRPGEADEVFQRLTTSSGFAMGLPAALIARVGRIEALVALGRLGEAEVQIGGLRANERDTSAARVAIARLALAQGRFDDAASELDPVINSDVATALAWALVGDARRLGRRVSEAGPAYDKALELDPACPEALLGRATLELEADRGAEARELAERARDALGRQVRPSGVRAQALTLLGRAMLVDRPAAAADARPLLQQAAALEGAPAEAHFFLARTYDDATAPEARIAYEAYLRLAPEGPYAARARRALAP